MKFEVSQKALALGGDYAVRNELGKEEYYFDGKVFNFGGKKVIVLDSQRREVARIRKKLFALRPTFKITRNGIIAATIRRRWLTFRTQFTIDVPGTKDYQVVGDFIGNEYTIKLGNRDIARISKKFFGAADSYGVEISGGEIVLMLCAAVVIDMSLFKKRKTF